ncbi:MAG: hypothetical protein II700_03065, partial [Firmicutes bacterium]|nr:hypothetical protein [Bacillota bacterium]
NDMKLRYMLMTALALIASAAEAVYADIPALPRPQELPEKKPSYAVPVVLIVLCIFILIAVIRKIRKK